MKEMEIIHIHGGYSTRLDNVESLYKIYTQNKSSKHAFPTMFFYHVNA